MSFEESQYSMPIAAKTERQKAGIKRILLAIEVERKGIGKVKNSLEVGKLIASDRAINPKIAKKLTSFSFLLKNIE